MTAAVGRGSDGRRVPGGLSQSPRAVYAREWRRKQKLKKTVTEAAAERVTAAAVEAGDMGAAIEWVEANLRVPSGPLAGQPFRLDEWQREWMMAAWAPGIQESGLSIARKNGKSGLIAAVLLAALCGPLNRHDWRGVVSSETGALAKELQDAMMQTAAMSGLDGLTLRKSPPPGRIDGWNEAHVRFLAADKATGHAIGADLALLDEAGLLAENQRSLWNGLKTSISGRNGRFWAISIQSDGPMFAEMEDRAGAPFMHWKKWEAPADMDIHSEEAWHAANPGLRTGIKSLEYMRNQAAIVKLTPAQEMHFRAWDLNQPVNPAKETIVTVADYARCIEISPPELSGDIVVGIDLGGSDSMTCAAALAVETGAMIVRGAFADDPPISDRAKRDRMGSRYDLMMRSGELTLYPGRVTPVREFLADFIALVAPLGRVVAVGLDRYRKAEAEQAFRDARMPPWQVVWRGTGAGATADGSHDVRAFQKLVRSRKLRMGHSPMLESAIANSVLRYDGAGNPALDKRTNESRIDAASAAVIAAGLRAMMPDAPLLRLTVV